jgi:exopolysaccharide production protein ExoZ
VAELEKLRSIQVLRGLAVVAVVIFHCTNLRAGRAGVDLFFCISGFVMAGQMHRTPVQFARDRFTRIYPPFLAALVLLLVMHPAPIDLLRLARSLLLFPDYHHIYLYPAWSLGYEAMFYAACVAAMFVGSRAVLLAFAALFLLRVPYAGSAFVLEFLAGFAIAQKRWWALPILLLASMSDLRVLSYGAPAALILWASMKREDLFARLGVLALIGDASYSIYLTHTIVTNALRTLPAPALICAAILAGLGFHLAVEKPLIRLSRQKYRFASHPTAASAEAG